MSLVLCPIFLNAADYETAQRLKAGDVISADVFNDIHDRIELSLTAVTADELDGEWDATQLFCSQGVITSDGVNSTQCTQLNFDFRDYTQPTGTYLKRSDTVVIEKQIDGTFFFTPGTYNLFFNPNLGGWVDIPAKWTCDIPMGAMISCVSPNTYTWSCAEDPVGGCRFYVAMNIERRSSSQIKMWYWQQNSNYNILILDKKNEPPESPQNLLADIDNSDIILTWEDHSSDELGFKISRKDSLTGEYLEIYTTTENVTTFTDKSLEIGDYWYRVFATNTNGDSIGTNIVNVTIQ